MPLRKSLRWKAASASRRSAAAGLVTCPASALIWASSLIAASARSSRLNGLSAANAEKDNGRTSAAAQAARTNASMGEPPVPVGRGKPNGAIGMNSQKHVEVVTGYRGATVGPIAARLGT